MKEKNNDKKTKIAWKGFFARIIILVFAIAVVWSSFFVYKIYQLEKQVVQENSGEVKSTFVETAKNIVTFQRKPLKGEERDRINVLLLGIGGEGHSGKNLTDTIILASINPKTLQTSLLSIPRDLYVEIPDSHIRTKINAVYTYSLRSNDKNPNEAVDSLKKIVEEITGQPVDYYITLDFEGFKKIVDDLGGVDVEVENDIIDTRYPGPNFSYQTFEIKKGWHHLDGETALKYSRVRHTKGGDFGRASRQQQVLASAKKKALSLEFFANPLKLNNLLNDLGEHLKTDIHFNEIPSFLELTKNVNVYQTTNKVLDAWSENSLLASSHVQLGGAMAYVLIPRIKNYSQIQELAENIFDLKNIQRKKEAIEKEEASILVLTSDYQDFSKVKNIFNKLGYEKIKVKKEADLKINNLKQTRIFSNGSQEKIFTLNDLVGKLEGEVVYEKKADLEEDIVIYLAPETINYFFSQNQKKEDEDEKLKERSIVDKEGNVLLNQ